MDLNAIFAPLMDFLATDFGQLVARVVTAIYEALFPANAEAAYPIPTPE
ncbi:hypothetical protein [Corynebacterium atypicum]|nr:hypothetical protein [Corynebacterium atypicum]